MKCIEVLISLRIEHCPECKCAVGVDWQYVDFSNHNLTRCPQCEKIITLEKKGGGELEVQKVRCNMCEWKGDEDELELLPDGFSKLGDRMWMNGCPTCKTDEYLMDIEGGEKA